jgi:glucose-6-phosphate isomerase
MAEFLVHILQAEHNESLADYLIGIDPYHDWVITVSFYSAIHYFKARLFIINNDSNNKHSDTSMPQNYNKSPHSWREDLIHKSFSERIWKSFRKLRTQSEIARYLTSSLDSNLQNSKSLLMNISNQKIQELS